MERQNDSTDEGTTLSSSRILLFRSFALSLFRLLLSSFSCLLALTSLLQELIADSNKHGGSKYTSTEASYYVRSSSNNLSDASLNNLNNLHNPDVQHALLSQKSLLQVHAKLYERHRVKEIVELLKIMLLSNISYHAQALQAYSSLLESLVVIEDSVQDPDDYLQ